MRRSAHQEAISHLTKGLELLKTLPDTPERTQQELTLQLALGGPLIAIKGYGAPEVEQSLHPSTQAVSANGGNPSALLGAARAVMFYLVRGEYKTPVRWESSACAWPKRAQTRYSLCGPTLCWGIPCSVLASLPRPESTWKQGIALYDPQQHRSYASLE